MPADSDGAGAGEVRGAVAEASILVFEVFAFQRPERMSSQVKRSTSTCAVPAFA